MRNNSTLPPNSGGKRLQLKQFVRCGGHPQSCGDSPLESGYKSNTNPIIHTGGKPSRGTNVKLKKELQQIRTGTVLLFTVLQYGKRAANYMKITIDSMYHDTG